MTNDIRYWMKGESVQNFGDFLSEYLLHHLFFAQPGRGRELRLIGSCIDNDFVEPPPVAPPAGSSEATGPIFWGCGLRQENGLSPQRQRMVDILAVRGPLTRSALRLGDAVPMGDPGLLLPALHRAAGLWRPSSATVLVPHFHEKESDSELLARTDCSAVLRPNIPNDSTAISEFIDFIVAADFVLCGAMHAAVIAAAYGRPFGFWDSGNIDLPFKWRDFAASVHIPCAFHPDLATARAHYESAIAPAIRIPVLWPLLVAAPLPVRPDAFVSVVALDVARHGFAALKPGISSRVASRLREQLADVSAAAEATVALRAQVLAHAEAETALRQHVAILTKQVEQHEARRGEQDARLEEIEAQLSDSAQRGTELQLACDRLYGEQAEARLHTSRLESDVALLRSREATLAAEEARLHEAVQAREHALALARADAETRAAQLDAMQRSITWRLLAPLRMAAQRMPWAVKLLRVIWWTVTLQLAGRLQQRRRVRGQAALLRKSPLFDAAYYLDRHPDVRAAGLDPAAHYVAVGGAPGHEACRLFDGAWYRATYPDCAASGLTPLAHYISEGASRGHDPHPLFDSAWYAADNPAAGSGMDALLQYLGGGAESGAAPNRLFDPAGYLSNYDDAHASGLAPLEHFLTEGASRGYDPYPLFETKWYRATYPEVAASGLDPLSYYLRIGSTKGHHATSLQRRISGFTLDRPLAFPVWPDPEVSIVVPAYGHVFDTLRCLHSVAVHSAGVGYEVIVLDDRPDRPIAPFLDAIPGLRVHVNKRNLGFLHSCNQAKTLARGWHIVFLNNDTLVGPGWLESLLAPVRQDPKVGIVGCKLLNADGTVQEAGGVIYDSGWGYRFGHDEDPDRPEYNYRREVDVVTGAAFLVRRPLFESLEGFDPRYAPAFYEEFDLAFGARRAGYSVVYQPRSVVTHLGSASYGPEMRDRQSIRNHAKFCLKWTAELRRQPTERTDPFLARQRPGACGIILMIDDKVPEYDRHAGSLTIFQYVKLLRSMGFRIVFCPADLEPRQPYTTALQDLGVEVLYAPVELPEWLAANGRRLTAVWTARPYVSAALLPLLRSTTRARILYYPHDLHYLREMRRYQLEGDPEALEEANRVRKLELAIFRGVDCVMMPSAEEAEVIRCVAPDAEVRVIPPYIYPAQAARSLDWDGFTRRRDVLFVGGFKHPPNVDAALWLVQDIMPLVWQDAPDTRLLIVGDAPPEEVRALAADTRVEVTGYVPDLAPYYARSRVSVSPLRYGAGVKGKIVSSLEAGIPVVTTAVGNEGIALVDGRDVLLGETPEELAAAVLRLLRDPALCASLSAAGVEVIRQRFSSDLARQAIQSVIGMVLCRVCGHVSFGPAEQPAVPEKEASAPRPVCPACGATVADQALADALLGALPAGDVDSLRRAVPELSSRRIHALCCHGPVLRELRESSRFTAADDPGVQTLRDGELDILVAQGHADQVLADTVLGDARRVLKPGAIYVAGLQDVTEPVKSGLEARLRSQDFDKAVRSVNAADQGGEAVVVVLTATRLASDSVPHPQLVAHAPS